MPPLTTEQTIELAFQHHQAGRLDEAERLYLQIGAGEPEYPDALHFLGVIAYQRGQLDAGAESIRRAIALEPDFPQALNNLGNILKEQGQLEEAIAAYRRGAALDPDMPEIHNHLGLALQASGALDEAAGAYRRAVALRPDFSGAYFNLGNLLGARGLTGEAIDTYRQVISLSPDYPEAHNNLGAALIDQEQLDDAIAALRRAIALRPSYPEPHDNLGCAYKKKGLLAEAIAAHRQALALRPGYPQAWNNLGNALKERGELEEAIAALRRAIALKPDFPDAHYNLGNALHAYGQLDEAIAAFHQAIALRNDTGAILNNLGNVLKDKGQLDDAIAAYRDAITQNYDSHSALILSLHYHPGADASAIARELLRWNQRHGEPLKKYIRPHTNHRDPDRRLRIGYVSPDFRGHPVGRFLLPLLANHDKQNVEVFAYAQVPLPDSMTDQLRADVDEWRDIVGLSDAAAADLIREDRIDILVDLSVHSGDNRLLIFAQRPAPVQVSFLGYAGSSGLTTMDYRLSDPYLDPPGQDDSASSEQTIRLPETYWCYLPVVDLPIQPPPAIANGSVTFGCLNNFCKVNEPLLRLWARILAAVPHGRLIMHAQQGSHRQRTLDDLQRLGIDGNRISFVGKLKTPLYFQQYQSIDIALDTHPFGGGTTTCDALWMGVPVVSLVGKTAVGRAGFSILSNVGLPELVARTEEQYIRIATDLAHDLPRLASIRSTLRPRMQASPLMDGPRFARNVESAYRQMWRTWCANGS